MTKKSRMMRRIGHVENWGNEQFYARENITKKT
jgi:hypothetical protein